MPLEKRTTSSPLHFNAPYCEVLGLYFILIYL